MRHTSENKDNFIDYCVRRDLPYLDAESANEKIIELTIKVMELQAEIDAGRIKG